MLKSRKILALFRVHLEQAGIGMRLTLLDICLRFIQILLEANFRLCNFILQFPLPISQLVDGILARKNYPLNLEDCGLHVFTKSIFESA